MLWGMAEAIFCQCPIYYEPLTLQPILLVNLMLDLPTPTLQTSHLRVCITYEAEEGVFSCGVNRLPHELRCDVTHTQCGSHS